MRQIGRLWKAGFEEPDILRTTEEILAGRSFADLSPEERAEYGQAREAQATAEAQAIVENLNRNVRRRYGSDDPPAD